MIKTHLNTALQALIVFGITASIVITGCSKDEQAGTSSSGNSGAVANTAEALATQYCTSAAAEAAAKSQYGYGHPETKKADDATDAVKRLAKETLSSADYDKFKELTKDCKDH